MNTQKTLVLIKPDGVERGLIGKILKRFEIVGLKTVSAKLVFAAKDKIMNHYPSDNEWFATVGNRTLVDYKQRNIDPISVFNTNDPIEIGKAVKNWLAEYMTSGPVFAMILEGYEAIAIVRKLVGPPNPLAALPGTIRGDFSSDNIELANKNFRPLRNLIHASGDVNEAEKEISVWFTPKEITKYKRADEDIIFGAKTRIPD